MEFVTYENYFDPHVTIHIEGCRQIRKNGGVQRYGQGAYFDHSTLTQARRHAVKTGLPVKMCSYCCKSRTIKTLKSVNCSGNLTRTKRITPTQNTRPTVPSSYSRQKLELTNPPRLWSRADALATPSAVPNEPGIYAWYFQNLSSHVPTDDCITWDSKSLLYIGIAPKAPTRNGAKPRPRHLIHRIREHFAGNAEGSTLRLTLGCVLQEKLGITLRRVGSGNRLTFTPDGERRLSEWMQDNAFVTWAVDREPWIIEEELIAQLSLPLNLQKNQKHGFYSKLGEMRRRARTNARRHPVFV